MPSSAPCLILGSAETVRPWIELHGLHNAPPREEPGTAHAAHQPAAGADRGFQPRSAGQILVVDDDPSLLAAVCDILDAEGYPVEGAKNGREALEAIERQRPALILLDMRMPILNGWELVRELNDRHIHLPIIVMTAATDAHRWANEVQAADVLPKPFDLLDLLAIVERYYGV